MGNSIHEQAMASIFEHMTADGRREALFGDGPERALDSYRRFSTDRAKPCVIVEFPLLGEPSYDVLSGNYQPGLRPGDRLADDGQTTAQAAIDWATAWPGKTPIALQFELDEAGGPQQRPGIHCRHRGQIDAAEAFYEAIGEAWRAPLYRAVAERMPREWICEYAAVFPGRAGKVTRMELRLEGEARNLAADDPSYMRDCFEAIGFQAYDQAMLDTISELASMCPVHSLQFDIMEDGTLGETFSLASFLESEGSATRAAFADDGSASRMCSFYERLGIADGRWRLIEGALLAKKGARMSERGIKRVISLLLPCCTKAKWRGAQLLPGKFYLTANAIVG
ncbi:MAG: hypothetical protein IJG82_06440 [Atopobiaceae bacterium]|nr:hypothetical protein [Atopobiaceae bacterium]